MTNEKETAMTAEQPESAPIRRPGAANSPEGYPGSPEGLRGAERPTAEELAEWRAKADAATEGRSKDAEFIAAARTAMRLLDEVERLSRYAPSPEVEALRDSVPRGLSHLVVPLAALIESRDREVRADECEAIAAELSDEHREALFLGGVNQPGTWGSVAARVRARADMHRRGDR